MAVLPEVFKAYDIRGLYGEQIDGDAAEHIGRAFVRVLAGLAGKARGRPAHRPRARHAPDCARARRGATATGWSPRAPGARRRNGRHRDALFPRRLARPRRRADVHRVAQPQAVHGRQARARGRDRAQRRPRHPGHPAGDRRRARRARRAAARSRRSTSAPRSGRPRCAFIEPANVRPLKVVVDGGNGMAGPMAGPLLERLGPRPRQDLLGARRRLPRPRAQPAARGEPPLHRRQGPRDGRRPRASPGTATPTAASSSTTRGRFVDGDFLTAILAEHLLAKDAGSSILYDVRASRAVPDTVERAGGIAHANRVGHAFFKTRMRDEGAIFGGEVSGHYYFHGFYNADSGTIPALLVLEKLSVEGKTHERAARAVSLAPTSSPARSTPRSPTARPRWPSSSAATPTRASRISTA